MHHANILRDLDGVHHAYPAGQCWPKAAIDPLTAANDAAHAAREAGRAALAGDEITAARTHGIIDALAAAEAKCWADKAYQEAGHSVSAPVPGPSGQAPAQQ